MSKQFTKEFKEEAVKYYLDHKNIGLAVCAKNLGTSRTALSVWVKDARENKGEIPSRGSDNYQNYGAPKIAQILIKKGETIAEKTVVII